jgi:beta-N-acetylhexosaminidase
MDSANPWLDGRHLGGNSAETARLAAAFVQGMQDAGVIATPKHFPGHRGVVGDPAIEEAAVPAPPAGIEADLAPFLAAIATGAQAVMLGPAVIESVDPDTPASLSPSVVELLRDQLGFGGLIVTDGLDDVSVRREGTLAQAGARALSAGADLLLVGGGAGLESFCAELEGFVRSGQLDRATLARAADRVRALADSRG